MCNNSSLPSIIFAYESVRDRRAPQLISVGKGLQNIPRQSFQKKEESSGRPSVAQSAQPASAAEPAQPKVVEPVEQPVQLPISNDYSFDSATVSSKKLFDVVLFDDINFCAQEKILNKISDGFFKSEVTYTKLQDQTSCNLKEISPSATFAICSGKKCEQIYVYVTAANGQKLLLNSEDLLKKPEYADYISSSNFSSAKANMIKHLCKMIYKNAADVPVAPNSPEISCTVDGLKIQVAHTNLISKVESFVFYSNLILYSSAQYQSLTALEAHYCSNPMRLDSYVCVFIDEICVGVYKVIDDNNKAVFTEVAEGEIRNLLQEWYRLKTILGS